MNKSAIQRFAIWARTELIAQVSQRAYQYGITKDGYGEANAVTVGGRALSTDEQRQRKELVQQIQQKDYTQVMEEVAYTWFNRFIALRFMEVNNYLPSHIRVFSDSTGVFKPEILNDVLHLELPGLNTDKVAEYIENNQTDDLYRYLLLTQCNALNEALPRMFERMGGYTELLLPNNILKQDGILGRMVTDIPEEDWTDQVQIIGWLYQFYNTELKAEVFGKSGKIAKNEIPAATQLFTPDWIVRYMVENSLGRLWIEHNAANTRGDDDEVPGDLNEILLSKWKYYLPEAEQEPEVKAQLAEIRKSYKDITPESIKVIDPCMGSGHILVYAFDVLMDIYTQSGWNERDAAQSILKNNLYGLDIDDRAAQLAYFAVMMKARQYDRRIFSRGIQPHVYAIVESNGLDSSAVDYFTNNDPKLQNDFGTLREELRDAKEYGSILKISQVDFAALYARVEEVRDDISMFREMVLNSILPLIQVAETMAQKYDVVVTNPPYMGASGMGTKLSEYVKKNYPDSKSDLFACFIERGFRMSKQSGFVSMITMESWMFLSSFEKMRQNIVNTHTIVNMVHMPYLGKGGTSLGINFGTAAVIFNKRFWKDYNSQFDYICYYETDDEGVPFAFPTVNERYKATKASNFSKIPGSPVAYWVSDVTLDAYSNPTLQKYMNCKSGIMTGSDEYIRLWHEPSICKIKFDCKTSADMGESKYFPLNSGGDFRKWYGNNTKVVNLWHDGAEIKANVKNFRLRDPAYYFRRGITWGRITSSQIAFREVIDGSLFGDAGPIGFIDDKRRYVLGFLSSNVVNALLQATNPTLNFQVHDIMELPLIIDDNKVQITEFIVSQNIDISRYDWDSFETSWDFKRHPLIALAHKTTYKTNGTAAYRIGDAYSWWQNECDTRFATLKANEEELNRIFIDIYGLQDELTPEVEDKDVTVRKADLQRDIRSLISYAVGCMFGRYSLDVDGLAYAGGDWDDSKYSTFKPDADNIIPICDDEYFDDDILGRFVKWVETVYGTETLEENLKFIADALGGKGTPREVIRSYFLNDFYADHLKIYQKRPIYWLFDSGKKNGFKALIYMHRYQSDLLARMRTDYVHEQQERYRTQLMHIADAIDHASASERVKLTKQQKKIQDQALEIQKYEEKIHHLADQNIKIDLDDGVKHNYELFADVLAKIK